MPGPGPRVFSREFKKTAVRWILAGRKLNKGLWVGGGILLLNLSLTTDARAALSAIGAVGPAEQVQGPLPSAWPDGNIGVIRSGNGITFLAAGANAMSYRTLGTLDRPGQGGIDGPLSIQNLKTSLNYAAGGPLYDDGNGMLLMIYHGEKWAACGSTCYHGMLGLARSYDGGLSWNDLGLIITQNVPFDYSTWAGSADIGGGSFVIKRESDGQDYFYVYFTHRGVPEKASVAVARARVSEVVSVATQGNAAPFSKYYQGAFTQPGIGGRASSLESQSYSGWILFHSVSYNTYLNKYVLITMGSNARYPNLTVYMESNDGLSWSPRQSLDLGYIAVTYPTILGFDSNPHVTSQQFYLYYIGSVAEITGGVGARWRDGKLYRRLITLGSGGPPPICPTPADPNIYPAIRKATSPHGGQAPLRTQRRPGQGRQEQRGLLQKVRPRDPRRQFRKVYENSIFCFRLPKKRQVHSSVLHVYR